MNTRRLFSFFCILFYALLSGCELEPWSRELKNIQIYSADALDEYSVNQNIKIIIKGTVDTELYGSVEIQPLLKKTEVAGFFKTCDFSDLESSSRLNDWNWIVLNEDHLGNIEENFSFKVTTSGNYKLFVYVYAYGIKSRESWSSYKKEIEFAVK